MAETPGIADFAERNRIKNRELAEAAEISESAISQILDGKTNPSKPTIDKLLAFCRTVDADVTYDALFGPEAAALNENTSTRTVRPRPSAHSGGAR